jgi:Cyclic nucleotide-binding domain/EamA-like transporter family
VNSGGGLSGLAVALVIAALVQTPLGIALAKPGIWDAGVLGTLALAGVLATLIPFTLEAVALRTLSMAVFGLVLAFEPAIAALAGVVIRGDQLGIQQLIGILLIVISAAGSLGPRGWIRRFIPDRAEETVDITDRGGLVEALQHVEFFRNMDGETLARIAASAEIRNADAGAVLTVEGEQGDEFFVIDAGEVEVTVRGARVRVLGHGDFFGEIAILFGGLRTATAVASVPCRLFVLNRPAFMELLRSNPGIEDQVMVSVSERMRYR